VPAATTPGASGINRAHVRNDEETEMADIIVWADIPVSDMKRAAAFYEHVTGESVVIMPGTGDTVAVIGSPGDGSEMRVSADLYVGGTPSHDGPTVYLGTGGDIDGTVARVVEAGGKVLEPKAFRGEMVGWIAFIEDTEGNRIGIQQPAK
jgi:predicted enzyme related to lactoylglutathione lyase